MAVMVVSGAMVRCSFGLAPCPLVGMGIKKVLAPMPIGCMSDASMASISTFGMCSSLANPSVASATAAALGVLTPMPCLPVTTGVWMQPSMKVLAENQPVLTTDSKLMCAYGGMITIMNPGQTKVLVK